MTKSTVGLIALNVFTMLFAVVGLTAQDLEPMSIALVLTLVATLVNSGVFLRRDRAPARAIGTDELDARAVLDLDARLEAVERAQSDAFDAARWRALAESGQVSGPADLGHEAGGAGARGHTRNGAK